MSDSKFVVPPGPVSFDARLAVALGEQGVDVLQFNAPDVPGAFVMAVHEPALKAGALFSLGNVTRPCVLYLWAKETPDEKRTIFVVRRAREKVDYKALRLAFAKTGPNEAAPVRRLEGTTDSLQIVAELPSVLAPMSRRKR